MQADASLRSTETAREVEEHTISRILKVCKALGWRCVWRLRCEVEEAGGRELDRVDVDLLWETCSGEGGRHESLRNQICAKALDWASCGPCINKPTTNEKRVHKISRDAEANLKHQHNF